MHMLAALVTLYKYMYSNYVSYDIHYLPHRKQLGLLRQYVWGTQNVLTHLHGLHAHHHAIQSDLIDNTTQGTA